MQPVQQTIVGLRFFMAEGMPVTVILQKDEAAAIARTWCGSKDVTLRLGGVDVNGMSWGILSSAVRAVVMLSYETLQMEMQAAMGKVQSAPTSASVPWSLNKSGLN